MIVLVRRNIAAVVLSPVYAALYLLRFVAPVAAIVYAPFYGIRACISRKRHIAKLRAKPHSTIFERGIIESKVNLKYFRRSTKIAADYRDDWFEEKFIALRDADDYYAQCGHFGTRNRRR